MPSGIYKFENKINHKIYIGQAIDLASRYDKHIKNINDDSHTENFYKGLRKYGISNFSYEILESFEYFDQELLDTLENYYINKYNSLIPNGYNMIPGGTNGAGLAKGKKVNQYDLKGNYIQSFSSAHQAQYSTGINYSSICACCRNEISHTKNYQWKYDNDDTKIIIDLSNKGIIYRDRKIIQYSLEGKQLKIFNSLDEIVNELKIKKSAISNVCRGKNFTAGGFIWRYEDNPLNPNEKIKTGKKIVQQFDLEDNLINEFSSLTEAGKFNNCNISSIHNVCKGKQKTAYGYKWKYKI